MDNLEVAEDEPRLVRRQSGKPAALILELPPQHFGEQAFIDDSGAEAGDIVDGQYDPPFDETTKPDEQGQPAPNPKNVPSSAEVVPDLPAARMRIAGVSRLAFVMPEEVDGVALSYTGVLDACAQWPLRLSVLAQPDPPARGFRLDRHWLLAITQSEAWTLATRLLGESVAARGRRGTGSATQAAARRLSEQMLADRSGATADVVRRRLDRTLEREIDTLQAQFEGLQGDGERELLAAQLSALAIRDYARATPDHSLDALARQPILARILRPHAPGENVTALELPYRLITSPVMPALFRHASEPVTRDGRTELWHTRLSADADTNLDTPTRFRALWSPDYELDDATLVKLVNELKPYRMSLDPLDRSMLVRLMAGFNEKYNSVNAYRPTTAGAERLHLSALGALLDGEGSWDPKVNPDGVDLEQWRHQAALGRDNYVRVVYRGYLFPFGHSASLIKVTERKFEEHGGDGKRIAVLRQRFFIVVREPVRDFDGSGHARAGRDFPFARVRLLTRVTPTLKAPVQCKVDDAALYSNLAPRECFWPSLPGERFRFEVRVTDIAGQVSTFTMPLLFVGQEANEARDGAIRAAYNEAEAATNRSGNLAGQPVCFAPLPPVGGVASEEEPARGDPRLPTHDLSFLADPRVGVGFREARTYPVIENAGVGVRAVQRLLNKPDAKMTVRYPAVYKDEGFGSGNAGEVFLETADGHDPLGLGFGDDVKSDALGAVGTPSMQIAGLSRKLGPASDLEEVSKEKFNPLAFFDDAKLLGDISVADLIQAASALTDAPQMVTRELPDRLEASFTWHTEISVSQTPLFVPSAGGTTTLAMSGTAVTPIAAPDAPTFSAHATLVNFKLNLFDFITIWFDRLQFESRTGSKPDVLVDLHPGDETVVFGGPLEFVNQLRDIIPMDGFSDPPNLTVTPSGLTAGYSLGLPTVGVGIFTLANISLGAGFSLPFDGRPVTVNFNFCERESPFSLTVSMFGGGGFFALGVGAEGVREIEAALEFGAGVAINLGVASGSVEVKAGVYFHWMVDLVELTGYVRLHGELSVIGLISASLTFNLQLSYLKEGSKSTVWGEASLVVEVEVLVFSGSVTVHCRREFAGSESDPTFLDIIPDESTWSDYCGAFALEGAT